MVTAVPATQGGDSVAMQPVVGVAPAGGVCQRPRRCTAMREPPPPPPGGAPIRRFFLDQFRVTCAIASGSEVAEPGEQQPARCAAPNAASTPSSHPTDSPPAALPDSISAEESPTKRRRLAQAACAGPVPSSVPPAHACHGQTFTAPPPQRAAQSSIQQPPPPAQPQLELRPASPPSPSPSPRGGPSASCLPPHLRARPQAAAPAATPLPSSSYTYGSTASPSPGGAACPPPGAAVAAPHPHPLPLTAVGPQAAAAGASGRLPQWGPRALPGAPLGGTALPAGPSLDASLHGWAAAGRAGACARAALPVSAAAGPGQVWGAAWAGLCASAPASQQQPPQHLRPPAPAGRAVVAAPGEDDVEEGEIVGGGEEGQQEEDGEARVAKRSRREGSPHMPRPQPSPHTHPPPPRLQHPLAALTFWSAALAAGARPKLPPMPTTAAAAVTGPAGGRSAAATAGPAMAGGGRSVPLGRPLPGTVVTAPPGAPSSGEAMEEMGADARPAPADAHAVPPVADYADLGGAAGFRAADTVGPESTGDGGGTSEAAQRERQLQRHREGNQEQLLRRCPAAEAEAVPERRDAQHTEGACAAAAGDTDVVASALPGNPGAGGPGSGGAASPGSGGASAQGVDGRIPGGAAPDSDAGAGAARGSGDHGRSIGAGGDGGAARGVPCAEPYGGAEPYTELYARPYSEPYMDVVALLAADLARLAARRAVQNAAMKRRMEARAAAMVAAAGVDAAQAPAPRQPVLVQGAAVAAAVAAARGIEVEAA